MFLLNKVKGNTLCLKKKKLCIDRHSLKYKKKHNKMLKKKKPTKIKEKINIWAQKKRRRKKATHPEKVKKENKKKKRKEATFR